VEREKIFWIAVVLLILFLVWETIKYLITPIVFGLAGTYIAYPFQRKLSKKVGEKKATLIVLAIVAVLSTLFLIGVTLWITDTLKNLYLYLDRFFIWLSGLNMPSFLGALFDALAQSFPEKLRSILLQYTLSLPKLALQLIVFLAVFYSSLLNADFLSKEIYTLLPSSNNELGKKLIEKTRDTLDAILKTWLFFSAAKAIFLALGFYIFDISNVGGSIAAGILCMILELLPVLGGWIMWIVGAIILWQKSIMLAILFALYGILTVSPFPDYFIKPRLVRNRASVSSVVALVGIFGGIMAFGAVGILLGPISIGLFSALLEAWKEIEERETTQPSKARQSQDA